jgi:hypothetical protein
MMKIAASSESWAKDTRKELLISLAQVSVPYWEPVYASLIAGESALQRDVDQLGHPERRILKQRAPAAHEDCRNECSPSRSVRRPSALRHNANLFQRFGLASLQQLAQPHNL